MVPDGGRWLRVYHVRDGCLYHKADGHTDGKIQRSHTYRRQIMLDHCNFQCVHTHTCWFSQTTTRTASLYLFQTRNFPVLLEMLVRLVVASGLNFQTLRA